MERKMCVFVQIATAVARVLIFDMQAGANEVPHREDHGGPDADQPKRIAFERHG